MFKKSERFSFKNRLPKNKYHDPLFTLRYEASQNPVYGIITSKRVSKKAVQRNWAKRMFTQALQEVVAETSNGYSFVFFLKQPYTQYSKSAIILELQKLLEKLAIR